MNLARPLHALGLLLALSSAFAASEGLLPDPSFEEMADARPVGFRVFPSPSDVQGDFYILEGMEGDTTHTGRRALQFHFPEGAEVSQTAWTADPARGGCAVQPGSYTCSFWVKAEGMQTGFHVWVAIAGYGDGKQPIDKVARSEYLTVGKLPPGEWQRVEFNFDISPESGVQRVAPTVVFKTNPDGSVNLVTPDTRVLVDDLQIEAR